jgi:hypothetical protein
MRRSLPRKEFFEEFCREFTKEMNRLRMEQRARLRGPSVSWSACGAKSRRSSPLAAADEPPPLLHPSMADLYRSKIEELAAALRREDTPLEASEMLWGRSC